ncbi:MAG: hypothetical protein R3E53_07455 [Myxococcota bacterium]
MRSQVGAARLRRSAERSASLPEFMVPSEIVFLERFPMTPNGKVDRKALPARQDVQKEVGGGLRGTLGELESRIAEGLARTYLDEVGVSNFFDLGGHSLLVVQAHRKLAEIWPMPVTLTDLYRFPRSPV